MLTEKENKELEPSSLETTSESKVEASNINASTEAAKNARSVKDEELVIPEPRGREYRKFKRANRGKKKKKVSEVYLDGKTFTEEDLFSTFESDPRKVNSVEASGTIEANLDDLFKVVGTNDENLEQLDATPYSYWRLVFKELFRKPMVIICFVILVVVILFAIFGPMIHFYNPLLYQGGVWTHGERFLDELRLNGGYLGPTKEYWFGLCGSNMGWFEGHDMWSCVALGTRLSLLLGIVCALVEIVLGILIGAAWGYFRWLDPIMIEVRNFIYNIPELLFDILLMQFFAPYMNRYGFWIVVLVLSLFSWLSLASFVRNQIIIIRDREYNIASQTLGTKNWKMITHNLLPYLISVIVTTVSTAVPYAISAEVGLSYFNLSFKVTQGNITLGQVLTSAVSGTAFLEHPYLLVGPLIVIVLLTVSFFYLGLALSDACDPKTHR